MTAYDGYHTFVRMTLASGIANIATSMRLPGTSGQLYMIAFIGETCA
jgi:hypothetical protein